MELGESTQNDLNVEPEFYAKALSDPTKLDVALIKDLTVQLKLGTRSYIRKVSLFGFVLSC